MLTLTMPNTFRVGSTEKCRINGKVETVTWLDKDTLRIEPDDDRRILRVGGQSDDLITFACGDQGKTADDYESHYGGLMVCEKVGRTHRVFVSSRQAYPDKIAGMPEGGKDLDYCYTLIDVDLAPDATADHREAVVEAEGWAAGAEGTIELGGSIYVNRTKVGKLLVAIVPLIMKGDRYECEILVGVTRPR
jgi:hypothetical protein